VIEHAKNKATRRLE